MVAAPIRMNYASRMKAPNLILRCYLKPSHGQYIAVCVDLCLAAQADTAKEARAKLEAQVVSYVGEALTIDRESADWLLTRKAPLLQRIEYHIIVFAHKLHMLRRRLGQTFNTILPVHVGNHCHA